MDKTPTEWMFLPLRRYAVFTGRARRAEYWWFALVAGSVEMSAMLVDFGLGQRFGGLGVMRGVVIAALVIPQTAVAFRRLHDVERSGWWTIAPAALVIPAAWGTMASMTYGVPTYGGALPAAAMLCWLAAIAAGAVVLVWTCMPGTDGPNRFGPDPFGGDVRPRPTD